MLHFMHLTDNPNLQVRAFFILVVFSKMPYWAGKFHSVGLTDSSHKHLDMDLSPLQLDVL